MTKETVDARGRSVAVLYHARCQDGFGAAWAVWKALGESAEYWPVEYGNPAPTLPARQAVYLLDFTYPRETILAFRRRHRGRLTVLDHHKTAEEALRGLPGCTFDMDKSGAMLAWEHFHAAPAPSLMRYIQDRDLWRWELPDSREIAAALWSYPMEFETWEQLHVRLCDDPRSLVTEGAAILRCMEQQTAMICDQARLQQVAGYTVPTVNATSLWSEVGEELLRRYPEASFVASYGDLASGQRKWSLRSVGDFDVSAVARTRGGGGHRNAAGFEEGP